MGFKSGFSAINTGMQIENILPSDSELSSYYNGSGTQENQENEAEVLMDNGDVLLPKKKNKKKLKKRKFDTQDLSPYSLWLLSKKSLSNQRFEIFGKEKSNKIKVTAKKSIKASEDIISEPLAVILMKQGHLLESKKMFQKLSIKFPEKEEEFLKYISDINELIERQL